MLTASLDLYFSYIHRPQPYATEVPKLPHLYRYLTSVFTSHLDFFSFPVILIWVPISSDIYSVISKQEEFLFTRGCVVFRVDCTTPSHSNDKSSFQSLSLAISSVLSWPPVIIVPSTTLALGGMCSQEEFSLVFFFLVAKLCENSPISFMGQNEIKWPSTCKLWWRKEKEVEKWILGAFHQCLLFHPWARIFLQCENRNRREGKAFFEIKGTLLLLFSKLKPKTSNTNPFWRGYRI